MNYSDSGLIVRVYTDKHGLISLIVKGIRGKKNKMSLFMPLSVLDMVINYSDKKELHFPKEFTIKHKLKNLHTDIVKTSLSFFLAELVYKTTGGSERNDALYNFLENSILFLDGTEASVSNFHLVFMLKYASFLGFGIQGAGRDEGKYFDAERGIFDTQPFHGNFFSLAQSRFLLQLLNSNYLTMNEVKISNQDRNILLNRILEFYYIHNEGIGQLKSAEVLSEVFG